MIILVHILALALIAVMFISNKTYERQLNEANTAYKELCKRYNAIKSKSFTEDKSQIIDN